MSLVVWNNPEDPYNYEQLATNWARVDQHDHGEGKGAKIKASDLEWNEFRASSLAENSINGNVIKETSIPSNRLKEQIGASQLASEAVETSKIKKEAVTTEKISEATINAIVEKAFERAVSVPTGLVFPWSGAVTTEALEELQILGYILCDGKEYDGTNVTYKKLYTVIKNTYGGESESKFKVPNLVGKVIVGEESSTFERGHTGGEKEVSLTSGQMPKHTHTDSGHQHQYAGTNRAPMLVNIAGFGEAVSATGTVHKAEFERKNAPPSAAKVEQTGNPDTENGKANLSETGNNESHENMPPYLVLNYIIRL